MKKYLPVLVLLGAGMTIAIPQASAEGTSTAPHKAVKKAPKKAESKPAENENHADAAGRSGTDFNCELGNKLTIYENDNDKNRIGLKWNKKVHELTRVETSTGANRFENKDAGLVWIGIPAKGMLLDSKKGQQLANECRNAEQMKARKSKA